ncbi:MAG: LuxR C-terminal-related transcriptional regulator [Myxococcota bacterium]
MKTGSVVLQTKVRIPPGRPRVVSRPEAFARWQAGLHRRFTVIMAPAGFGKTTQARAWTLASGLPVAWLSLDRADRAPWRFFTYVLAAIRKVYPTLGADLIEHLAPDRPLATDAFSTHLLNEVARAPRRILFVLDDVHLVATPEIVDIIGFWIDHLPETCHLVLITRQTLGLPLDRYRVRDQVTEVGPEALRFTLDEARRFFEEVMATPVDEATCHTVLERTEGWVAGLQAAGLALARPPGVPARHVRDGALGFLEQEVFDRVPADLQRVLLDTSILDTFCGGLCEAVTPSETTTGPETLRALGQAELFVVPLDAEGEWVRYHHLFREMLRLRLARDAPERIPQLHARASGWYAARGQWPDAAGHAVAAGAFDEAAEHLERAFSAMSEAGQIGQWREWLSTIPDDRVRLRPQLCLQLANATLIAGEFESSARHLAVVETALAQSQEPATALRSQVALWKAYHAQACGRVDETRRWAERAIAASGPAEPHVERRARALLGLACWSDGDLEQASTAFTRSLQESERSQNLSDALSMRFVLAELRRGLGQLSEATRIVARGIEMADRQESPGVEELYRMAAELDLERGDLEAAAAKLRLADVTVSLSLGFRSRFLTTRALLEARGGDLASALRTLDQADACFLSTPLPDSRPLAAVRARVLLMADRRSEAARALRAADRVRSDNVRFVDEFAALTATRLRLAVGEADASSELGPWRILAEQQGRTRSVMEIALLEALFLAAADRRDAAHQRLAVALALASVDGHVQLFLDDRSDVLSLLATLPPNLQSPFSRSLRRRLVPPDAPAAPDALSQREVEVLSLVAQGLSNSAISKCLFVALDTVKGHNRRIFRKLGARSRTEAVVRARELGILA